MHDTIIQSRLICHKLMTQLLHKVQLTHVLLSLLKHFSVYLWSWSSVPLCNIHIRTYLTEWPTTNTYMLPQLITNSLMTMYLCHFVSSHTILNGSYVGMVIIQSVLTAYAYHAREMYNTHICIMAKVEP